MLGFAGKGKPGPRPPRRYECGTCGGGGTVPIDPNDRRKGERQCPNCHGQGDVG